MYRIRRSKPVHFLHIRKAGGTAIKEALRPIAQRQGIILHGHGTKLSDIPLDHLFFFFLRHPLSRFVSGFYSRLRQGMPRYFSPWTEQEIRAFGHFKVANDLAEAISSVDPGVSHAAQEAMRGISHLNSTYNFWFDETELRNRSASLVLLGLQEQLDVDFEVLKSRLNLPPRLRLPGDDVRAHRNPAGTNRNLSPLAEKNLRQWYANDIRFYESCVTFRTEHIWIAGAL